MSAEAEKEKEENQIEKEIVKQMLRQKKFAVFAIDVKDDNEIYNNYEKYTIIAGDEELYDLLTIPEFKDVFTEDQRDMLNTMYENMLKEGQRFVSKLIRVMYEKENGSCTVKNSAIKLLLLKAERYFTVERKVVKWNQNNYTGVIDFIIRDGDEKLATIRKEVYYCNHCVNDRTVFIGIQKCEKFSFK